MTSTDINFYILRVKAVLREEQDDDQLTPEESEQCRLGFSLCVTPGECAAAIIINRADLIRQRGGMTCQA